jgi:hypothetical protein
MIRAKTMYILSHTWLTLIMLLGKWNQLLLSRPSLVTEYWTTGKVHIHPHIYTSLQKATLLFTSAQNMQNCQYNSNWFFQHDSTSSCMLHFHIQMCWKCVSVKTFRSFFFHHHYTFSYYIHETILHHLSLFFNLFNIFPYLYGLQIVEWEADCESCGGKWLCLRLRYCDRFTDRQI